MISELTTDSLFDGEIIVHQFKEGYRFSLDSVLVAHFIEPKRKFKILDLGCGSGIIGFICLYRWLEKLNISVTGLELQKELYELCNRNIKSNQLEPYYRLIHCDVRKIQEAVTVESFDMVLSNPPFFKVGTGRTNNNDQEHLARHQVNGGIKDFLKATFTALKNKSYAAFVYPASELAEFIYYAKESKLEPKQIQPIYNYPKGNNEARLVLVKCQKNGGVGLTFTRPFYIYREKNGEYDEAMQKLYSPN